VCVRMCVSVCLWWDKVWEVYFLVDEHRELTENKLPHIIVSCDMVTLGI